MQLDKNYDNQVMVMIKLGLQECPGSLLKAVKTSFSIPFPSPKRAMSPPTKISLLRKTVHKHVLTLYTRVIDTETK